VFNVILRPARNKIYRFGPLQFTWGFLNDVEAGRLTFVTQWETWLFHPDGRLKQHVRPGPGLLTADAVNQMITQLVTSSAQNTSWSNLTHLQYGIAATPAYTDGDTGVTTEGSQARAALTLSQSQTATTSNHAGIMQWLKSSDSITATANYTEMAIVNTASGAVGHCLDHRAYSPTINAASGDTATTTYTLQLNSNV
jgi:hypothetical protein